MNSSHRLQVLRRGSPRIALAAAPTRVHAWVERVLGSPIVAATTQTGGFSPGVAARVRCADGSRAFVKAVGAELNPDSPALIRREIEVLSHLPESIPRPTMLGSYDVDGWVGLLLEDVAAAAVTGMFLRNSRRPAPPGLPTLRAFQAAYADALLRWTKERTGWR